MKGSNFESYMQHLIKYTKDRLVTVPASATSFAAGIASTTLSPHTSHKLQSLDKTFRPFKTFYDQVADDFIVTRGWDRIYIPNVIAAAFPQAIIPKNTQKAFESTRILLNTHVSKGEDYFSLKLYISHSLRLHENYKTFFALSPFYFYCPHKELHHYPLSLLIIGAKASAHNQHSFLSALYFGLFSRCWAFSQIFRISWLS